MTQHDIITKAYDMKQDLVEHFLPLMKLYFEDFEYKVEEPTKGWVKAFIDRLKLKKVKGESMEENRRDNATTGSVKLWFEEIIKQVPELLTADPKCVGNFDETMANISNKGQVVIVRQGTKKRIN